MDALTHEHSHDVPADILLEHLLEHNRSHIAELERIAEQLQGISRECLIKAIGTLELGCDQLEETICELQLDK